MSFITRQAFDLHVCFSDEGSNRCVAFDLYHRWTLPECRPRTLCSDDFVLRCEARFWTEDFEPIGFPLRFSRASNVVRFGRGRRRYRFPFTGTGSGGNMYWEIIGFRFADVPHVLNWLRRSRLFQKIEWIESFDPLWEGVRRFDAKTLRDFGASEICSTLRRQAENAGCTVKELIRLSMPQQEEVSTP